MFLPGSCVRAPGTFAKGKVHCPLPAAVETAAWLGGGEGASQAGCLGPLKIPSCSFPSCPRHHGLAMF